jgi:hypothetical protein
MEVANLPGLVPLTTGAWLDLEDGVQAQSRVLGRFV